MGILNSYQKGLLKNKGFSGSDINAFDSGTIPPPNIKELNFNKPVSSIVKPPPGMYEDKSLIANSKPVTIPSQAGGAAGATAPTAPANPAAGALNIGLTSPAIPAAPTTTFKPLPMGIPDQPLPLTYKAPTVKTADVQAVGPTDVPVDPLQAKVIQTGQEKVIGGFQTPTLDLTSQRTQELLKAPAIGPTPEEAGRRAAEQYGFESAQQLEALRQRMADVGHTGTALDQLIDVSLRTGMEKTNLQRQTEGEQARLQREDLLKALSEGRATSESERTRFATDISSLAQAAAMGEPQAQREFQAVQNSFDRGMQIALSNQNAELQGGLTELKGKIDKGLLLTEQDFTRVENELNREMEKAMQANDINAQLNITKLQQEYDAQKQKSIQEFQKAERIATQAHNTAERLDEQDFNRANMYIQNKFQKALQAGDIQGQKDLFALNEQLQLKMQTNEMNQAEKMAHLNNSLAEARANGDVERQKNILTFTHAQEMERIRQEQGFEESMMYVQNNLQKALQDNDHVNAMALQKEQLNFQMNENIANRNLETMKIELQKQGINMEAVMQQVQAGMIEPDAAVAMLQSQLPEGVKLETADAEATAKKAMDIEYNNQLYQWGKTHPGMSDPNSESGLTQEGLKAYNDYFNKTVMGEVQTDINSLIDGTVKDSVLRGKAGTPEFNTVLEQAKSWTPTSYRDSGGFWGVDVMKFSSAPAIGEYIKKGDQLFKVTSSVAEETKGNNYQYFTVMDVNTGTSYTIQANQKSVLS